MLQFSEGHPICAVCGRGDLDPAYPDARGCYDTKVTSWSLAINEMAAEAVNGPTTGVTPEVDLDVPRKLNDTLMTKRIRSGYSLPPFDWNVMDVKVKVPLLHEGQPSRFNFAFERHQP